MERSKIQLLHFLTIFLIVLVSADCFNILAVFPHSGRSHFDAFRPLLEGLAVKGHQVTVLGYFPSNKNLPNFKDIVLNFEYNDGFALEEFANTIIARYRTPINLNKFGKRACKAALGSKEYQRLLKSNEKYDLIISEFFNTNCLLMPAVKTFKVPFIAMQSHVMLPWTNDWVGNPSNPAYIPAMFSVHSSKLSFMDRVENTVHGLYNTLYFNYFIIPRDNEQIKEHLGQSFEYSSEMLYNTSLIFVNSHFTLHGARPFVPNVIEIGGIHIKEVKKLPVNIEKWINESTHGVIYFSLGSMIKGHTFPEEKRQMFLKAFGRLPQRVLWKWETETMPEKPDNVMLQKWMPQFDILCHPNVKAFIAHGGLLGATEAVHCGVPMIVMPQFGDQFTNAKAIEASGGGVILDFRSLDEESIYNALKTVLEPDFNKKAKELSARFRDRPLPPLETAIYWVEYVARHGGAPHLRTAAVGMPLYKYLLLDVIAFLAAIVFAISFIFYLITRAIFRKIFATKPKVKVN